MSENKKINIDKYKDKKVLIPKKSGAMFVLFDWLKTLLPLIGVAFIISTFFVRISTVNGLSMAQTLHDEDRLVMTNYYVSQPEYGDIVIISHGQHLQEPIVKRVIATQGQKIDIDYDKNVVYIDDKPIDEPYINEQDLIDFGFDNNNIVVPEDMIFVMGDNRNNSLDSRSEDVGLIPVSDVIGKAEVIFYPLDRIQYLYD